MSIFAKKNNIRALSHASETKRPKNQLKTGTPKWAGLSAVGVRNTRQTYTPSVYRFEMSEPPKSKTKETPKPNSCQGESNESVDSLMRTAYSSWSEKCRNINIPTTPAYDVVGLLAVLKPEKFNIVVEKEKKEEEEKEKEEKEKEKEEKEKKEKSWNVMTLKEEFRGADGFQKEDYVLHPEKFNNLDGVMTLKEEFRGADGEQKEDYPLNKENINLIVLTDFGEECDDEVTSLLVPESAKLVFTDEKHFDQNRSKYKEFGGKCTVHHFKDFSNLFEEKNKNVVLQIGPVHEAAHGVIDVHDKKYDWYLVGTIGGTLNSKGDAQANAEILRDSAQSAYVVDTARGEGAFPFTYNGLKSALKGRISEEQLEKIAEHVIKIGWRNTVGRANPFVGKYVSHLVVKNVGANYKTVDTVLRACLSPEEIAKKSWTSTAAAKLAKKYLARLQTTAPDMLDPIYDEVDDGTFKLKGSSENTAVQEGVVQFRVAHTDVKPQNWRLLVDKDGNTNTVAAKGVTEDQIVEGYTFILVVLNKLFGVPIEFFESGMPGKWQPQWENPGLSRPYPGLSRPYPFVKTI
jgi:hypothetical protein